MRLNANAIDVWFKSALTPSTPFLDMFVFNNSITLEFIVRSGMENRKHD